MKTTKITLEITPDEAFEIAYAIEWYIKDCVDSCVSVSLIDYMNDDAKTNLSILEHFVDSGYVLSISRKEFQSYKRYKTVKEFQSHKYYKTVDEWYKALVANKKKELKAVVK